MIPARSFTAEEWAMLHGPLRLTPAGGRDRRSMAAGELLDDERCAQLLETLGPVLRSPTTAITASLLSKRLSFLATAACLYAMSACDKGLLLSPDNCLIEYGHDDGRWTSSMPLHDMTPFGYAPGERHAWRNGIVRTLFAGLLAPLWQTLARSGGVSSRILWENTAVRVYSLYERRLAALDEPAAQARCAADCDWLLNDAEPALFGLDFNPLRHFRRPPTRIEGRDIRLRRTCCFYYKTCEPVTYCGTCPLLKPKRVR